jgi:hypothetical protein
MLNGCGNRKVMLNFEYDLIEIADLNERCDKERDSGKTGPVYTNLYLILDSSGPTDPQGSLPQGNVEMLELGRNSWDIV